MRKFLDEHGIGEEVEIQNVVVFYNPRAELSISAPPRPVANAKGLKKAIRKQPGEKLSSAQYKQLGEAFDQAVS